jgi:hypothetical protein
MPVTTPPVLVMLAVVVGDIDHVPPTDVLVSVVVIPSHTVSVPPMADGKGYTVTIAVVRQPVGSV